MMDLKLLARRYLETYAEEERAEANLSFLRETALAARHAFFAVDGWHNEEEALRRASTIVKGEEGTSRQL